jgi:PIN domain nuclease of toxin-antitoxin system
LQLLPIEQDHIYALGSLPSIHRDPFDRLLIAQALHENIPIVSDDSYVQQYPVNVIW